MIPPLARFAASRPGGGVVARGESPELRWTASPDAERPVGSEVRSAPTRHGADSRTALVGAGATSSSDGNRGSRELPPARTARLWWRIVGGLGAERTPHITESHGVAEARDSRDPGRAARIDGASPAAVPASGVKLQRRDAAFGPERPVSSSPSHFDLGSDGRRIDRPEGGVRSERDGSFYVPVILSVDNDPQGTMQMPHLLIPIVLGRPWCSCSPRSRPRCRPSSSRSGDACTCTFVHMGQQYSGTLNGSTPNRARSSIGQVSGAPHDYCRSADGTMRDDYVVKKREDKGPAV